jgi:hypothetical protein
MSNWDTATPAGSDPISQGPNKIREMKSALQDALNADGGVFPGPNPSTAPVYYPVIAKGDAASRPAASTDYPGRMYWNTDTDTIQRVSEDGTTWEDTQLNPGTMAIHVKGETALASVAGVVTLDETSNAFAVSGTEDVTGVAGWNQGLVFIRWTQARTLMYSATFLTLRGVSRPVLAGDVSVFRFFGINQVREVLVSALATDQPVVTRTTYLTGSGTYTTPANVRQLRIRMLGGGAGGGGTSTTTFVPGNAGGDSSFNSIVAAGGHPAPGTGANAGFDLSGGAGGTGGAGAATLRQPGGPGSVGTLYQFANSVPAGNGGNSALGGGGLGAPGHIGAQAGANGAANTGGGGGGGANSSGNGSGGAGGGAGEYVELVINAPGASYSYAVGAGGSGGAGTSAAGGNGGSGIIIIDELY